MENGKAPAARGKATSLGAKLVVIGVLAVVLQAGAILTLGLVRERQGRLREAAASIQAKWGGPGAVAGPVLTVPLVDAQGGRHQARLLPDELTVTGKLVPERRSFGIFETVVYTARLELAGKFTRTLPAGAGGGEPRPYGGADAWTPAWDEAQLSVGIRDLKGVREAVLGTLGGRELAFEPGVAWKAVLCSGVGARVPLGGVADGAALPFSIALTLNGSERLGLFPLGRETRVELASSWAHPSFQGEFLPESRTIGEKGFAATWKVINLNRAFPQAWVDRARRDVVRTGNVEQLLAVEEENFTDQVRAAEFGVGLLLPVVHYLFVERAVKYSLLFIGMTFMAFLAVEILTGRRVHPVQYLLVGAAVTLFYVLLLALAEHVRFGAAYLAAAAGVVGLVTAYGRTALRGARPAAGVGGVLVTLYGFLFVTLRLEDYALLVGALGVFGALAAFMLVTRNVDWYSLG
jgi:inner membrane protein